MTKSLFIIIVALIMVTNLYFSVSLHIGGGFLYSEGDQWPGLDVSLSGKYWFFEQSMVVMKDFGIGNFFDIYGKIDWVISPMIGIGGCWGYFLDEKLFFEKGGFFVVGGALMEYDRYSLQVVFKQYVPFFEKIQFSPLIQIIGRFKIGEWWE